MEIKRVNILFKLCKMHPYGGIVETGRAVDWSGGGRGTDGRVKAVFVCDVFLRIKSGSCAFWMHD